MKFCLRGLISLCIFCLSVLAEPVTYEQKIFTAEAQARISQFTLSEGIQAELFVDSSQTQNPGAICFDRQGKLYIAEVHRWRAGVEEIRNEQRLLLDDIDNVTLKDRQEMYERDQLARPLSHYTEFSDRIVVVQDVDGDGRADTSNVYADGFNEILDGAGIGLLSAEDGSIYYTNIPHLWRLKDEDGDGVADTRESLQKGFGVRMSISGHDMHGLVRGPDGKIYWSIGDRGYHITTKEGRHYSRPVEGAVFRCDPDGSNLEEYYRGLRNPHELAFDQYGNLFTVDNNADHGDLARLVYLIEGGDAGWTHGHQVLMNFRKQYSLRTPEVRSEGKEAPLNPWNSEKIWDPNHKGRPDFALPPVENIAWGPSGLVYNYGITAVPDRYAEHFWVCNFGGAIGNLEAFTVAPEGAGFKIGKTYPKPFMVGMGNTDIEFGPDGKMYLACFNNSGWVKQDVGNVYTLFNEEKFQSEAIQLTQALIGSDFSTIDLVDLEKLLGYGDMRVRQAAQFELAERGASESFLKAVKQTDNRLMRLHGVWGLGQLARRDGMLYKHLIAWLKDEDEGVRAQSAKILSDSRVPENGEALLSALEDSSDRVKAFAAIGVGKCRIPVAIPKLIEILEANDNDDLFLRHSIIQGFWYLNEKEKLLKLVKHDSGAVRLAVLLTMRKLEDPRVKYFLEDKEERIRFAAIRAINDLNLFTAMPDLAVHLDHYIEKDSGHRIPESPGDLLIQHRLINANHRDGSTESAERLIDYVASEHLPEVMREQALDALAEWADPTPVDPTVGLYRPIDPETRTDIGLTIRSQFDQVYEKLEGELLAKATGVALSYDAEVPESLLLTLINNRQSDAGARVAAMRGLQLQDPSLLQTQIGKLLDDPEAGVRGVASELLLQSSLGKGIETAIGLANSKHLKDRQYAYRNLASVESPEVDQFFAKRMTDIRSEMPGAILDLVESAEMRSSTEVKRAVEIYREDHPANTLADYQPCLEGGDPGKGKHLFLNHGSALCAKCHRVGKNGGEAGPELTQIAERSSPNAILESLIEPNAVIAQGYGITTLALTDGSRVGGILVKKNKDEVVLLIKDNDEKETRVFPMNKVAGITQSPSAMPSMKGILSKTEIRDLMAYLSRLGSSK